MREETDRLHLDFARLVVEALELSWDAMRGDFEAAEAGFATVEEIAGRVPVHNADYALAGAVVSIRLWQDRRAEVLPLFEMLGPGPMPITSIYLLTMLREGLVDRAREAYSQLEVDLSRDDWYAPVNWAGAAEVAVGLGDAELGATAYALLEPYAGHAICAGSGLALGPVDAFLACAAAATGDRDAATRHADTASGPPARVGPAAAGLRRSTTSRTVDLGLPAARLGPDGHWCAAGTHAAADSRRPGSPRSSSSGPST